MNNDLSLENWKDVEGYEGLYLISDHGRVMSVRRHRENGNSGYYQESKILKPSKTTTGYWKIELYKNNKKKSFKIHRLVANHFIANPYNKPEVNHIDGDKLNNKVSNLEWVTRQENVNHAIDKNLRETFFINKASLIELYIGKNMSPNEIAALFGISRGPIDEHIEKYGIKKEVSTKYGITEKQLKTLIQLGKTNKEIAEEIGCDPSLISHYKNRIERTGKIYG